MSLGRLMTTGAPNVGVENPPWVTRGNHPGMVLLFLVFGALFVLWITVLVLLGIALVRTDNADVLCSRCKGYWGWSVTVDPSHSAQNNGSSAKP